MTYGGKTYNSEIITECDFMNYFPDLMSLLLTWKIFHFFEMFFLLTLNDEIFLRKVC